MAELKQNRLKGILFDLQGRFKLIAATKTADAVKEFDWKNAILDSVIFAAIGFFTTYTSGLTAGLNALESCHLAIIAAGMQFVTFLGIKRGIVKQDTKTSTDTS